LLKIFNQTNKRH